MAQGWLKLHRKILKSAVSENMELLGCWVWILTNANWEERQLLDGTVLQPGQLVVGMEKLGAAWACSKSSAYRRTQKFERLNMIDMKPRTQGTLITVCNWSEYQLDDDDSGTQKKRQRNAKETQAERKRNAERNESGTRAERGAEPEEEERREEVKKKEEGGRLDLPPILDSPEFRSALESWQTYRGTQYKPRGLSSLVSQAAKRAADHGINAVINAFEVAMGNGWKGWNQDSSFSKGFSNGNNNSRIGPGQRHDPNRVSTAGPTIGWE